MLPYAVEDVRFAVDRLRRFVRAEDDALRDPLTGLLSRRAFVASSVGSSPGTRWSCSARPVQGGAGTPPATVCSAPSARPSQGLRVDDHAARLGGDEFAAGLEETGEEEVRLVLEHLRGTWRERRPLDVSFSAGIAPLDEDEEARSALERADAALYRSKGRGRDRITVASELAREVTDGP